MHPYLNIAIKAARSAGTIIVRAMDRMDRVEIGTKSSAHDFATSVDRAAEAEILHIIKKAYPDHGILAEESGEQLGTNPNNVIWIIDPLDGTFNFVHGIPHFCVSIGIQIRGVMEHAVIYNPVSNELFTATKGSGAQLDERKIRVSECRSIANAVIATGFAYKFTQEDPHVCIERGKKIIANCANVWIQGSAALDLAYVAAGRLDGFSEFGLSPWDVAAGSLLVREAGGFVTDFNGDDKFIENRSIVAATPKVFPALLELVK